MLKKITLQYVKLGSFVLLIYIKKHMVEITHEENPIVEKLKICTVVAVFAALGKTILQFRLSSRVIHFLRLIAATGLCFFSKSKKKCSKTF